MIDRRNLLRTAAALAAARFLTAASNARIDASPARIAHDPFALGVASGEPTNDGFVLWTRLIGIEHDRAVAYEIADDDRFHRIVRRGSALAPIARGGAVHVEVAGLRPGRPYFYRFHFNGVASRIGRTMTVPHKPTRLRVALTSCQHWEQGWFSAYRDIAAQGCDIVLQVGDYIYEKSFGNGPDVRMFGTPGPHSLAEYRDRYALYRADADLADAHAAMPFLVTWDDHEVENDYAGALGVETADAMAFVARRTAAYQAYFEHMPLRPSVMRSGSEVRLYRRVGWGGLATFHVLDSRQYRSPHPCATAAQRGGQVVDRCAEALDPSATMLGAAQERWLAEGLASETARWSLVTQQTLFARLHLTDGPTARYSDIWDGYAATQARTIAALSAPAVRNAVILSGDVHSFWLNDIHREMDRPETPRVATEVVTTCLASHNGPTALFGPAMGLNPHVRYLDNAHAGYALLDVTPERMAVDLRAVRNLSIRNSASFSLAQRTIVDHQPGVAA